MKRVVVTGGLGFIGSHLTEALLKEGLEVVVLDSLITGRRSNLARSADNKKLKIVEVDIREREKIMPYFEGADTVFHLAALADVVPSIREPTLYFDINVTGTVNVLEATKRANIKNLIYIASSSCYGIPTTYPTPETAAIQLEHPYALTKYLGEQTALHWGKVYKIRTVSLRLFNVFGPRHRTTGAYGAVFGVFLAQRLAGKPLTVVGDGTQTRDFTHVYDVIEAILAAAKSNVNGGIFNVGSGNTYSVNRLAELIGGEKIHIPKRPGEPDSTFADIRKIQTSLGWKPKVKFEEGVSEMMQKIDDYADSPIWTPETIAEQTSDWFRYLS